MNTGYESKELTFCVLISCMHQQKDIIQRSNVQTNVVVVNQCDENRTEEWDFQNKQGQTRHAKFICTTERGLSRSRNMAIKNCVFDICQICDDDELLPDNLEDIVLSQYKQTPQASLITFALEWSGKSFKYPVKVMKVGFSQILRTSSLQITFCRKELLGKGICFDEMMGSGTGNGGGEENKFLLECYRAGMKILYEPVVIATIKPGSSKWFKGYTDKYFRDKGWVFRRTLGNIVGLAYISVFPLIHLKSFKRDNTLQRMYKNLILGYFEKR